MSLETVELKEETSSDDDSATSEDEKLAAEASYMIYVERRINLKHFNATILAAQGFCFQCFVYDLSVRSLLYYRISSSPSKVYQFKNLLLVHTSEENSCKKWTRHDIRYLINMKGTTKQE